MPIISGTNIPVMLRVSISLIAAAIIYSSQIVKDISYNENFIGLAFVMMKEFIIGLLIAFVAYVVFSMIFFVGQIIDYQLGLSMAAVYDPVSQMQVPISGNLIYFMICLLFMRTGGFNAFFAVAFNSYKMLPPGESSIIFSGEIVKFFIDLLTQSFSQGVKFALPIMGCIIVLDIGLGILVKAVPQANVFVVGVPLKLIIGFALLFLTIPVFMDMYDFIFSESYRKMIDLMQGLVLNGR